MTFSFFKLHVAGDDFILIDLSRASHQHFERKEEALRDLASAILDRRKGVGGRACIFVGLEGSSKLPKIRSPILAARIFNVDGTEDYSGLDALFCIARWALDSGEAPSSKVRMRVLNQEYTLNALDSRSFLMELPCVEADRPKRIDLLIDGHPAQAYLINLDKAYAVVMASSEGAGPKRIRKALSTLLPQASSIVVSFKGLDILRFGATEAVDRIRAATASLMAANFSGRIDGGAVAEWRGRGRAISYAHFDTPILGEEPGALIDRGRFWIEWKDKKIILAAGMAEYAFEGSFDH
ncbi:hypothetical protein MASR2M78_28330 [Treponema sp.]|jgi:hypothetical protein